MTAVRMIIIGTNTFPGRATKQFYASPRADKQSIICLVIGTSRDAAALMSSFDQFKEAQKGFLLHTRVQSTHAITIMHASAE